MSEMSSECTIELQSLSEASRSNLRPTTVQPRKRLFQVWSTLGGQSRFFCGGKCFAGPNIDCHFQLCTWCSIALPCIFYYVFCARYLWDFVSPWLPVLTTISICLSIVLLVLTATTDPGIIPRAALQIAIPDLPELVAQATGCPPLQIDPRDPTGRTPLPQITWQQEEEGYRWCPTCKIVRPPRASHCRDCDNCVLRFDHHCPFVNNCIGQRNYVYFIGFLASIGVVSPAVFSGIWLWLTSRTGGPVAGKVQVWLILAAAPMVLALPCVTGLLAFHAFLNCTGQTTKERLSRKRGEDPGRQARGPTLCGRRGRSLIPAGALVHADM
eukprot:TRINITY_DN110749_c0_g1_i1.p1 TRINITY_DN110749_c0_g1~~TRINITY_DN110749_c0_g1_i1.p1  ORF type:complete len:335 (+),score=26.74 TRINITY_DN110749_c0_g1_i1:29-1006(+)